ncbi:MAG: ABC transporter ATP-binding protein [Patescibacteria group bacterium]|nr:ABC transporter ATP-binding protein [Patescibacteria group bacterium]MDE1944397.1 ABC transporter ATP-binding protein [Patescibacteria group bacterium]MDE1945206.1 ABC transporter ATP-binding protein [Patescibacteria group bacterium]MDE2057801.1 ABC transporter ATP-binding protein [Patescibacteria group bacterium]
MKSFKDGERETRVLKGIDLEVGRGEFVSIVGRSGAGKSTLMYQMSLLDEPTEGDVLVEGRSTREMATEEETLMRLTEFGYVFQDYALLPDLSALENVVLPLLMQGKSKGEAEAIAARALAKVELTHRLKNLPSQMSGGEQQRAAIARAIAHAPKLLFADEPTANLDRQSSGQVVTIFKELHAAGQTIIMVTHEEEYARAAGRIVTIDDGKVLSDVSLSEQ